MVWHLMGKVMKYLLKRQQIDVFFLEILVVSANNQKTKTHSLIPP